MKFYIVLSLLLIAVAAKPSPRQTGCVAPKTWEANTYGYDHHTSYYTLGHMSYDAVGMQVRFVEKVDANSTRAAYDTLSLFAKKTQYRIDLKTRKCSKTALSKSFRAIEILPGSTYTGEAILGSLDRPENGVVVQTWTHRSTDASGIQVFTREHCLPIEEEYIGKHDGVDLHYHFSYSDIRLGVSSPEIFDVPKECL